MTEFAIKQTVEEAETRAQQIPVPCGYHLLCMVPKVENTFGGKITKPDETMRVEEQVSVVLYVAKVGPDAYKDTIKFPSGPWCKEKDFVIVRAYSGTRLLIHGTEWRLINDDSVDAVVDDPRGVGRP